MTPILKCNILQLANNQRFSRICAIFDNQCKIRNQKISYFFFDSRFFLCFNIYYIYIYKYIFNSVLCQSFWIIAFFN